MAIHWHWPFGPETSTDLNNNRGFTISSLTNVQPTSAAADIYTYTGSPTRYSLEMTNNRTLTLPALAAPTTGQGWVAAPFKMRAGDGNVIINGANLIEVQGTTSGRNTRIQASTDNKSLWLYVDQVFKESTPPYDWDVWHYVALQYDQSVNPWSGRIYVDGVAATSLNTDPQTTTETNGVIRMNSAALFGDFWLIGQVLVYDSTADAGEVPKFVTRLEPNADGTSIGTWTPNVGSNDFDVLDTPMDTTTYTQNSSPSALDRVEVLTNGGGSDIDTALGTTTTAVDSVMVHGYSSGQALTARVLVGDGTVSETPGGNQLVAVAATTYNTAVANTKPSGGAWSGTDTPEFIYEVVST